MTTTYLNSNEFWRDAQRAGASDDARNREARLAAAASALLAKIDNMTTLEFERGGERAEREALRAILTEFSAA